MISLLIKASSGPEKILFFTVEIKRAEASLSEKTNAAAV